MALQKIDLMKYINVIRIIFEMVLLVRSDDALPPGNAACTENKGEEKN